MTISQADVLATIRSFAGQPSVLTIPRVFIQLTGDIESALLLSQVLYWTPRSKDTNGWVYKTYAEWEAELGLRERPLLRARRKLTSMGILETKLKKANGSPTVHYRIKEDAFVTQLVSLLRNPIPQNAGIQFRKTQESNSAKRSEPVTETTSETTSETTTEAPTARKSVGSGGPRATPDHDAIRAELERTFSAVTHIPPPKTNTQAEKRKAGARWWAPLREMAELTDWDAERGSELIRVACERMIADGLTIAAPQSILNVAIAVHAERDRPATQRRSRAGPDETMEEAARRLGLIR